MMQNPANRTHDLHEAFHAFGELSERLAESYRLLQERVSVLTEELAAARSERLQQLTEKERLANRLQQLLEALPGAVVVLDSKEVIQECNPVAMELLGGSLHGKTWGDVVKNSITAMSSDGYYATLSNGRQVGISSRGLGSEPGRILLLKDDTENRRLQDMLNRHQRLSAMGEMVARLAHQIRTPLTSAMLYVSHLRKPQCDVTGRVRYAEKVLAGLRQLERMVNDMLVFARGGEFTPENVSIRALFNDLRQIFEPQLQQNGGQLRMINACPEAVIDGCHDMLLGALLNLVTNAMQACDDSAELIIEANATKSDAIEIRVKDNGPGIDLDIQEKIFDPFFTTRSGGTGLGLAVVRAVMQGHHGDIQVISEIGRGTTFILTLPRLQGEHALASGVWQSHEARSQQSSNSKVAVKEW